ncbi:hypothetical protein [Roseovarius aquimarinus]|uniref:Uncharacterized protein n=1 Tax=Roseovarius aquimarinus TaxID=1229156 RepID=A0ABW7I2D1_9RHOB
MSFIIEFMSCALAIVLLLCVAALGRRLLRLQEIWMLRCGISRVFLRCSNFVIKALT